MAARRIPVDVVLRERTRAGLLTTTQTEELNIVVGGPARPGATCTLGIIVDGNVSLVDVPVDVPEDATITVTVEVPVDRPSLDLAAARAVIADVERR